MRYQMPDMPQVQQPVEEDEPWWAAALKGLSSGLGSMKKGEGNIKEMKQLPATAKIAGQWEHSRQSNPFSGVGRALDAAAGHERPDGIESRLQDEGDVMKHLMGDMDGGRPASFMQKDPYDEARSEYESAINAPVKKKAAWKDALFKAATIASNMFNPQNQLPVIGLGRAQYNQKAQRAYEKLAPLDALKDKDAARQYKQKQIENIDADNQYQRDRLKSNEQEKSEARRGRALSKVVSLKRFNPNDPTHAAIAKDAGLDPSALQGWDDRNPIEKQVAGVTYRLDRETGAYKPTDLPTDESKTLTDYKIEMPNGEMRTYKVAQKDAANFATQMHALGLRLQQSESQFTRRLALDEKKFSQAKSEFERIHTLRQQADARQDTSAVRQYNEMLLKMWQEIEKDKTEGAVTPDQYEALMGFVNGIR